MSNGRSITNGPSGGREEWEDWEQHDRQKIKRSAAAKSSAWSPDSDDGHFTPSPMSSRRASVHRDRIDDAALGQDEWWKGVNEQSHAAQPRPSGPPALSVAKSSHTRAERRRPETSSEKARIRAEENFAEGNDNMELPPPYSEKQRYKEQAARHMVTLMPPLPHAVSPRMTTEMSQRGGIGLADMPSAPAPAAVQDARLPDRAIGTFIPGEHHVPVPGAGPIPETERQRRRHEREDYIAYKLFGAWDGRGCFSQNSYLGRPGREGRKRRRMAFAICGAILGLIIAAIVLGVTLIHRATSMPTDAVPSASPGQVPMVPHLDFNPILNLETFPPIPTGLLTVVGANNSVARSDCIDHPSMWTCALSPEQTSQAGKYQANQPTFVFQIQYDDSDLQLWNQLTGVPPLGVEVAPTPTPSVPGQGPIASAPPNANSSVSIERRDSSSRILGLLRGLLLRRSGKHAPFNDGVAYDDGFTPNPQPPTFQEYWFLGNTSDGIVSNKKAGEATPFFISMLADVSSPRVGPNQLSRRAKLQGINTPIVPSSPRPQASLDPEYYIPTGNQTTTNLSATLPPAEVNADGTGAPARLLPLPTQQPLRLFDRGLPTEHYGFFAYFNKTVYVHSVSAGAAEPAGGVSVDESRFVATFGYARYKVQIWTRLGDGAQFVGGGRNASGTPWGGGNDTRPGTFPFPITFTVDLHGGPPPKFSYWRTMMDGSGTGRPLAGGTAGLLALNMTARAGDVAVNPSYYVGVKNNPSFGGYNGGVGGCECRWQNFEMVNRELGPAVANPFAGVGLSM